MRFALFLVLVAGCAPMTLPRSGLSCPDFAVAKTANDAERGSREWCEDDRGSGHGPWIRYYPSGVRAEQTEVTHGKIDGTYLKYFESGKTQMVTTWRDYRREGVETRLYENGSVEWQGAYVGDRREGIWHSWFPNGNAKFVGMYEQGTPIGVWRFWNGDGTPSRVEDLGVAGGQRLFDENNVLREVIGQTNGQLVDHWLRPW